MQKRRRVSALTITRSRVAALQRVVPARRLVAVHRRAGNPPGRAPRSTASTSAASASVLRRRPTAAARPRAPSAGRAARCVQRHALVAQPVEQRVAVRRRRARRPACRCGAALAHAVRHRQQVQVVVAQQAAAPRRRSACSRRSTAADAGPAVDQVAEQVERVAAGREVDLVEQALQRRRRSPGRRRSGKVPWSICIRSRRALLHGRCPADRLPDRLLNGVVRHVRDGAHRQPQGAPAGDGRSGRRGRRGGARPARTTRRSSCRRCRSASPRSACSTASSARRPSRRRWRTGCETLRHGRRARPSITATALVVTIITFLTIIFGELVPKRIGQLYPEPVARWWRGRWSWLATAARPFVRAAVGRHRTPC